MLDPTIPLTIGEWDEWGDPREPAMRAYMESYSPYDNPPAGPRPDLLVTGSLHDPRVLVHEPAKWVARLRATSPAPGGRLLFRPELGRGRTWVRPGVTTSSRYEAEILAFILDEAASRRQPTRTSRHVMKPRIQCVLTHLVFRSYAAAACQAARTAWICPGSG